MELLFVKSESTCSYFEATCYYIDKHGKPLALYSDKAGVFRVNNKHATGGEGHTQFGRAMHELNIQTICAETSEAKGRVERAHLTLQDRLVKELRLQSINSMEAANAFAEAYIADYNRRFGKAPRHDFDVHRAVEHDEDLDLIFTVREHRKVSMQSKRDNTRSKSVPSGDGPSRRRPREEGKKSQRSLNNDDMLEALKQLQSQSEEIFGKRARTGR